MIRGILRGCIGVLFIMGVGDVIAQGLYTKKDDKKKQEEQEKPPMQRQIEALQKEKAQLQAGEELASSLKDISQQIATAKQELQDAQGEMASYLQLKVTALQKWYQNVSELMQTRRHIMSIIDEHIALLQSLQERAKSPQKEDQISTVTDYDTLREYAQKLQDTQQKDKPLWRAFSSTTFAD